MSDFWMTPVAKVVPFDPTIANKLVSRNVQAAIDELSATASVSASPGYTWGGKGTVTAGSYLDNDGVPSNITGRVVTLASGYIERFFVSTQNAGNFSFDIQTRSGAVFTTIATVTMTASRKAVFVLTGVPVVYLDELCVRVSPSSAQNPLNVDAGALLKGSI